MTLFHYTCSCAAKRISKRGFLRPNPQPALGGMPLVWLTDQDKPNRFGLGLTSNTLKCDRLECRYRCETDIAEPWTNWLAKQPFVSQEALGYLLGTGRQPEHWYVAARPVWAERDY
jgi:hypothetical protein